LAFEAETSKQTKRLEKLVQDGWGGLPGAFSVAAARVDKISNILKKGSMFGENRRLVYCEPVPLGK
jgi:hypothetical protein